jgi:hypothetical protein
VKPRSFPWPLPQAHSVGIRRPQPPTPDARATSPAWGTDDPIYDLDGSRTVNGGDLGLFLSFWGDCCSTYMDVAFSFNPSTDSGLSRHESPSESSVEMIAPPTWRSAPVASTSVRPSDSPAATRDPSGIPGPSDRHRHQREALTEWQRLPLLGLLLVRSQPCLGVHRRPSFCCNDLSSTNPRSPPHGGSGDCR